MLVERVAGIEPAPYLLGRQSAYHYAYPHRGIRSETHFDMTAVATVTPKKAIDRTGTVVSRLEET